MDKVVVYAGTRNVYDSMYVSLKSLLINTPVDRVYLLIEDDTFPYALPDKVHPVNVSVQDFFPEDGANMKSQWSYMDLLRCAMGHMMPDEKQVLWLDIDTIVNEDISELFDIDMTGYFFAGVLEPAKSRGIFRYINSGVTLHNLELLRGWMKEDEMIAFLNQYQYSFPGQDIINLLGQGRIKLFDSEFNSNGYTMPCVRPKIIHYAAIKDYKEHFYYKKYARQEMPMEDKDDA